jgi:hypothetical protein
MGPNDGFTVSWLPVSTRMLITLAVICGVLILAAAGLQFALVK